MPFEGEFCIFLGGKLSQSDPKVPKDQNFSENEFCRKFRNFRIYKFGKNENIQQ